MAKQIQPVNIWVNGSVKVAEQFSLRSINDDLETSATFYFELMEANVTTQDADGNNVVNSGAAIANGNLNMSGQDYQDWGNQSGTDINTWAYDWAAGQLNLVII
jgi:hypothetical protein